MVMRQREKSGRDERPDVERENPQGRDDLRDVIRTFVTLGRQFEQTASGMQQNFNSMADNLPDRLSKINLGTGSEGSGQGRAAAYRERQGRIEDLSCNSLNQPNERGGRGYGAPPRWEPDQTLCFSGERGHMAYLCTNPKKVSYNERTEVLRKAGMERHGRARPPREAVDRGPPVVQANQVEQEGVNR